MSEQKFLFDRDLRGQPLEFLIAQDLYDRNIPFGFNPYSGTEDPRREDYDIYVGQPESPALLLEAKMDWRSGLTGNIFVEQKAIYNTKAPKIAYGRLLIDVFDTNHLRRMYEARPAGIWLYRHVLGGDQANNPGMLLGWKDAKENSQPYWKVRNQILTPVRQ